MADAGEIPGLSASALSQAIATRRLAAAEVMAAFLDRIEAANPAINAIVSLRDRSDLMAEAEAADGSAARGWLHGLPVAVKDLVATKGLRTTYGSPLFRDFVPAADDLVAARLSLTANDADEKSLKKVFDQISRDVPVGQIGRASCRERV